MRKLIVLSTGLGLVSLVAARLTRSWPPRLQTRALVSAAESLHGSHVTREAACVQLFVLAATSQKNPQTQPTIGGAAVMNCDLREPALKHP